MGVFFEPPAHVDGDRNRAANVLCIGSLHDGDVLRRSVRIAALAVFVPHGSVMWPLGIAMGAANVAGGYLGARTAVARGTGFVRVVFITVVGAFVVRIGGQLLGWW